MPEIASPNSNTNGDGTPGTGGRVIVFPARGFTFGLPPLATKQWHRTAKRWPPDRPGFFVPGIFGPAKPAAPLQRAAF
jgi:hypothetical protein